MKNKNKPTRLYIWSIQALAVLIISILPKVTTASLVQGKITLKVSYKQYKIGDSIRLYLNDAFAFDKAGKCFRPKPEDGKSFTFEIPVEDTCGYFSVRVKRKETGPGDMDLITDAFWEQGDSVSIKINRLETKAGLYGRVEYSGKGADKYTLVEKMTKIHMEEMAEPPFFTGNLLLEPLAASDPTHKLRLAFLEQNRDLLSPLSYAILKADLIEDLLSFNLLQVRNYFREHGKKMSTENKTRFVNKFHELFFPVNSCGIEDKYLSNSKDYLNYLNTCFSLNALMIKGDADPELIYKDILKHSTGKYLREKSLLLNFIKSGNSEIVNRLYEDAEQYMLSAKTTKELIEMKMRFGQILPDYTFVDNDGREVRISDFKNKIILIDMWLLGCGGCVLYYKDVLSRIEKESFINKDVVVLSISSDNSVEHWKRGLKAGIYTSDRAKNVYAGKEIGFLHPFWSRYGITKFPTQMLVDRSGKIVNFKTPDLLTFEGVMEEIKKLL